jgi:V8-like Glu-specific endopeptidase
MKNAKHILAGFLILSSVGSFAQALAPDQNPNYQNSAEKYAEKSVELTATQSETTQDTYKAYDYREAKAEKKQARIDRQHELRKLRMQNRYRCGNNRNYYNGYPNGNYNNQYYNNSYGLPSCGTGFFYPFY